MSNLMTQKQSIPEICSAAFVAARTKCSLSVEELAHLACLSKKQIQQIENGGRNAFYSLEIKYVAAKKVAKLIQLDEKEAFDFGPQAELPFVALASAELGASEVNNAQVNASPKTVSAPTEVKQSVADIADKKIAVPLATAPINQSRIKQARSTPRNQNSPSKKWFWVLPVGALVVALVQFQPLLKDQLDALIEKQKPVELLVMPSAPPADAVPINPNPSISEASTAPTSAPTSAPTAAPTTAILPPAPNISNPLPVVAGVNTGCPSSEGPIETYKPPSAGKPGNVVFVRTNSAQSLCVVDADGVVQSKNMDAGLGHSFYGKPPFKLLSSVALGSAEIFFQGFRMRPNAADMKSMLLVQVD